MKLANSLLSDFLRSGVVDIVYVMCTFSIVHIMVKRY